MGTILFFLSDLHSSLQVMNVNVYRYYVEWRNHYRHREIVDLLISWGVLTVVFSWRDIVSGVIASLPIYGLAVLLSFVIHELAHRNVARKLGAYSYYQAWYSGLLMALLICAISGGRFTIAAPGAVVVESTNTRISGIIALWGPLANAIMALCMYPLYRLCYSITIYALIIGNVNALLALFNALPIPPLDGYKVLRYSPKQWLCLFTTSVLVYLLYVFR